MKPILLVILCSFLLLLLFSCSPKKNEDITQQVNKNGAVETAIAVNHLDANNDEIVTTHLVWVKDSVVKKITYRDTIPSLGKIETTVEDKDGETKKVMIDKAYELFITIK